MPVCRPGCSVTGRGVCRGPLLQRFYPAVFQATSETHTSLKSRSEPSSIATLKYSPITFPPASIMLPELMDGISVWALGTFTVRARLLPPMVCAPEGGVGSGLVFCRHTLLMYAVDESFRVTQTLFAACVVHDQNMNWPLLNGTLNVLLAIVQVVLSLLVRLFRNRPCIRNPCRQGPFFTLLRGRSEVVAGSTLICANCFLICSRLLMQHYGKHWRDENQCFCDFIQSGFRVDGWRKPC